VDYGFGFLFPSCIYFFLKNKFNKKIKKIPLIIPVLYKIFHQIKEDFDNLLAWWTKS
jgi:hypothetical protein